MNHGNNTDPTHRESYADGRREVPLLKLARLKLHQQGSLANSAVAQQNRLGTNTDRLELN